MSGAAIAEAFNDMLSPLFGSAVGIAGAAFILLFVHGLNIALAVMGVAVHAVRLNTLEFSNGLGLEWSGFASSDIEVDFSEADAKALSSFVMGEFAKQLKAGVKVESDKGVKFGFRVKLDQGKVSHEFTEQAMAESLSALLRPQLAKIVNKAAQGK